MKASLLLFSCLLVSNSALLAPKSDIICMYCMEIVDNLQSLIDGSDGQEIVDILEQVRDLANPKTIIGDAYYDCQHWKN